MIDVFVTLGGHDGGVKGGEGSTSAGFREADPTAVGQALATPANLSRYEPDAAAVGRHTGERPPTRADSRVPSATL